MLITQKAFFLFPDEIQNLTEQVKLLCRAANAI